MVVLFCICVAWGSGVVKSAAVLCSPVTSRAENQEYDVDNYGFLILSIDSTQISEF